MSHDRPLRALLGALLLTALPACSSSTPSPHVASSASQPGYAEAYPQALSGAVQDFNGAQDEVKKTLGEVDEYPNKLKDPPWSRVHEILRAAHDAGKSRAYVERTQQVEGARRFFAAEKDEITRKVSWAGQAAAKKSCDVDIAGSIAGSLKDAVDKQLDKEMHEANDAHRLIERYRVDLGKENAAALEKQADAISRASYLAHVQIVDDANEIRRLAAEAGEVRSAGQRFIDEERAFQADKRTTAPEKKASEARVAEMTKSQGEIDAAVKQAEAIRPKLDDQVRAIEKEDDDKMEAFLTKLAERGKK
ncbi:MAG: hypothetical protein U0359_12150 [Byssovorax sp.]